jgi:hypothetical protein
MIYFNWFDNNPFLYFYDSKLKKEIYYYLSDTKKLRSGENNYSSIEAWLDSFGDRSEYIQEVKDLEDIPNLKDLNELYVKGTRGEKMFVCETVDRNSTSVSRDFYPNIAFCGAPKECETVAELCHYIQTISSHDHTAESKFLGQYDRWCMKRVEQGKINLIEGVEIGTKTVDDKQIILDDLMSNHYLDLYKGTYGILIPSNELLNRLNFGWFVAFMGVIVPLTFEENSLITNFVGLTTL